MKISNFISGYYSRISNLANALMLILIMGIANTLQADENFEALDREFLEFLSLYEVEDEEILAIALDQQQTADTQSPLQTEGEK